MTAIIRLCAPVLLLAASVAACGGSSSVTADELAEIVRDESVAFPAAAVHVEILDVLGDYEVVIIGETHLVSEQRALSASLIKGLHERGVRKLLLEWPHSADWAVADYVADGPLSGSWRPPIWLYGDLLIEIRDFNRSVANGEKITVRGIDANLENYGGGADFRMSLRGLHSGFYEPTPIHAFLSADYATPEEQAAAVTTALADLAASRPELVERWGEPVYDMTVEMLEVEAASIDVRAETDDEESASLREAEMKRLADLRLAEGSGKAVVNVGGNHAQKERLRGTHTEWIGDYLVNRSPVVAGSAVSILVLPATIVDPDGTIGFDIRDESPAHELLRVMSDTWPDQTIFLPFDNEVFLMEKVAINIEGTVTSAALKRHWDAVIVMPVATRIPLPA